MTDKDYLQIAKNHLEASADHYDHEDHYVGPDTTRAAQAQVAALITIAEEWRKYNEREEMILAKTRNFVVSPWQISSSVL